MNVVIVEGSLTVGCAIPRLPARPTALTPTLSREREREKANHADLPPLPPAGEGWGEGGLARLRHKLCATVHPAAA